MDFYRSVIKYHALKKSGEPIYNSSIEHTQVAIEWLLLVAESRIQIVTERVNPKVYQDARILRNLEKFLVRGGSIYIISEKTLSAKNKFINTILTFNSAKSLPTKNCFFFKLENDEVSKLTSHFFTADSHSYRFEPNKLETEAVVTFGDTSRTECLSRQFDKLKAKSILYKIDLELKEETSDSYRI